MKTFIIIALIIALVVFLYILYRKHFKVLKVPSVCLITGGVKTGKSLLSVNLSIKDYKKRYRSYWIATKIFKKDVEMPLYYTNVFITFGNAKNEKKYNKKGYYHKLDKNIRYITTESLLREERYNYGSVIYIQEASLMADNMDFNNKERNIDLSLYAKLIAHETRGGALYIDTQSILDVHYSFKRVSSTYLFIQKNLNLLLFHVLYVREMVNTENGVNNFTDDVETTTRKVLIPFWYHHKYDRYEYSYLTDDLQKSNKNFIRKNGLVSFNPLYISHSDKRKENKK